VTVEDVVFVARGSSHALQAANEEQGHARCDQNGDGVFVDREPLNQAIHRQSPTTTYFRSYAAVWTQRLTCFDAFLELKFTRARDFINNFFVFLLAFRGRKGEYSSA
jgi:hypothetical protein